MARTHAKLLCSIWDDEDWLNLPGDAQRLYQLLLSQKKLTLVGLLPFLPARWAMLLRLPDDVLAFALGELEDREYVVIDRTTAETIVRTFTRNDPVSPANPRQLRGLWNAWEAIESPTLRQLAVENMPDEVFVDAVTPPEAQTRRSQPQERTKLRSNVQTDERANVPPKPATCHQSPEPEPAAAAPARTDRQRTYEAAISILVDRRQAAAARKDDPQGWLEGARSGLTSQHFAAAAAIFRDEPGIEPQVLADRLEPPLAAVPRGSAGGAVVEDDRIFLPGSGWVSRT